jgi:hypothetical protein
MPGITSAEPQKPGSHGNGQGIKQGGLARSIDPDDEVEPGMKLEFPVFETFEIFHNELINSHIEPTFQGISPDFEFVPSQPQLSGRYGVLLTVLLEF